MEEAAAYLGVSTRSVEKYIAAGTLISELVPRPGARPRRLVPASVLEQWVWDSETDSETASRDSETASRDSETASRDSETA